MSNIFGIEFFPTPPEVIERMLEGYSVENKVILEPSAGKGNIVDYCKLNGAKEVLACESHTDLQKILAQKCKILTSDFFELTSDKISHIDCIIMNPPFSNADKHINHAWDIAPAGCTIISLCNSETVKNGYSKTRSQLHRTIEEYGHANSLGNCFDKAERETGIDVSVIQLYKPGGKEESEFSGFFTEEDDPESQNNGIIAYNEVRNLVNRYVSGMKLFDKQIELGFQMNTLIGTFYKGSDLAFTCTEKGAPKLRNDLKKQLQKDGWSYIFEKMDLRKNTTRGLRDTINKFVEQQNHIPFTMRNIYHMLDVVIGTTGSRMDQALVEIFDKLTMHDDENRFGLEGWKTNSHYLLNQKFIVPNLCWQDQRWYKGPKIEYNYSNVEVIDDFVKALCYITGDDYTESISLANFLRYDYKLVTADGDTIACALDWDEANRKRLSYISEGQEVTILRLQPEYGKLFEWTYFQIRAYKKGTMHFKFLDQDLWAKYNQHISRIKGYPLYESKYKSKNENKVPVPEPEIISPTAVAVYMTPNIVVREVIKQEAVKHNVYQPELF